MIVADENIPAPVVAALRAAGLLVTYISEVAPSIDDEAVLALALGEGALLLTAYKDFGELVYLRRLATAGVVLLRLGEVPDDQQARVVTGLLDAHQTELIGAFTVVTPSRVRIRPRRPGRRQRPPLCSPPCFNPCHRRPLDARRGTGCTADSSL